MGRLRWWLWCAALLLPSVALAQPALYPGTNTSGFVAGQGTATAITKWTNKTTITAGSLADTATQANKSVCFADGSPPLPVLNCGDAGIKYTKGSTPTLNLGVNGQYQVNGITVLGSSSVSLFEATAPSGVPNYDILYADSSAHRLKMLNNNGSADTVLGAATTDTLTHKTYDTAGTGNVFKVNGTSVTALSGNTGTLATVSGSFSTATDSITIDADGNLIEAGEAVRTFGYSSSTGATAAASGTQYMPAVGVGLNSTESNVTEVQPALEVRAILCGTPTAVPGGGKSWTMTVRDGNAGTDCGFTCAITDASDNCSGAGTCTIAAGHALDIKIVPAGTPTVSAISCYIAGVRTG